MQWRQRKLSSADASTRVAAGSPPPRPKLLRARRLTQNGNLGSVGSARCKPHRVATRGGISCATHTTRIRTSRWSCGEQSVSAEARQRAKPGTLRSQERQALRHDRRRPNKHRHRAAPGLHASDLERFRGYSEWLGPAAMTTSSTALRRATSSTTKVRKSAARS